MKSKKIFKRLFQLILMLLGAAAIYIALVYLLIFIPSFSRLDEPSEEQNREHFATEENYAKYEESKKWFWNERPDAISVDSFDGLKLSGYVLKAQGKAKGTAILLHGYHSEPIREFTSITEKYHELGYNVILPFERAHGASEGKYITFGVRERFDVLKWIQKANALFGNEPIFIHGISMGCATALMSLELDLPENVRGVIADCGFTTPRAIIWKVLTKDFKIPTAPIIMKIGDFFAQNLAHFSFDEASTLDAIERNKKRENQIPILFFHGGKDEFVPIEMTGENFMRAEGSFVITPSKNAEFMPNPQSEKYSFIQIEDAPHAISALVDEKKYFAELSDFLSKYGGNSIPQEKSAEEK